MAENTLKPFEMPASDVKDELVVEIRAGLETLGFNPDYFKFNQIISYEQIRNGIIRNEYQIYIALNKKPKESIIMALSEKYGLEYGTVKQIIGGWR
jgi:hypothetical protein